jgi:hypothetical protein
MSTLLRVGEITLCHLRSIKLLFPFGRIKRFI